MRRVPRLRLAVIGLVACTACARTMDVPSTPQGAADVATVARDALARLNRAGSEPPPCGVGWAESTAGYVVAVGEWAEGAGLRPGDHIVAVNGAVVASMDERLRAYGRAPAGGPFTLGVLRQDRSVTLRLPCRHQPELFRAERRALEAASRSDWDGCVAWSREARALAGISAYPNVIWEHACARAKTPSMTAPEGREFAALSYETARLLLRDSRHVPGGTTNIQPTVRQIAEDLRRSGSPEQADDLEKQLQTALATLPRLELTWADHATDEHGYMVERRIGRSDAYQPLATLPPNTVTYVDTAVQEGVTYCYRVKAFRSSSYSDPTNEVCAVPKPPSAPVGK